MVFIVNENIFAFEKSLNRSLVIFLLSSFSLLSQVTAQQSTRIEDASYGLWGEQEEAQIAEEIKFQQQRIAEEEFNARAEADYNRARAEEKRAMEHDINSQQMMFQTQIAPQKDEFVPFNYIAGGVLKTHVDVGGQSMGWSSSNTSSNGYNLIAGRQFNPQLFGEIAYADMGEVTLSNQASSALGNETINYKVPSAHLGYLLMPGDESLNMYVKGGVSVIKHSVSNPSIAMRDGSKVQLSFGAGTQWQSKESGLFARAGADYHDKNAIAAGLSVGYQFGKKLNKK
jgi:hypothetical protein